MQSKIKYKHGKIHWVEQYFFNRLLKKEKVLNSDVCNFFYYYCSRIAPSLANLFENFFLLERVIYFPNNSMKFLSNFIEIVQAVLKNQHKSKNLSTYIVYINNLFSLKPKKILLLIIPYSIMTNSLNKSPVY